MQSWSSRWKRAFGLGHQVNWSITVSDSIVLQRRQYQVERPMWFRYDQELDYEAATRNVSTRTVWYNLDVESEPPQKFWKAFSTAFQIQTFQELFYTVRHGQWWELLATNTTTAKSWTHEYGWRKLSPSKINQELSVVVGSVIAGEIERRSGSVSFQFL